MDPLPGLDCTLARRAGDLETCRAPTLRLWGAVGFRRQAAGLWRYRHGRRLRGVPGCAVGETLEWCPSALAPGAYLARSAFADRRQAHHLLLLSEGGLLRPATLEEVLRCWLREAS